MDRSRSSVEREYNPPITALGPTALIANLTESILELDLASVNELLHTSSQLVVNHRIITVTKSM